MNLVHNVSDNWGWYVDTENLYINNVEQRQYVKIFKKTKNFNIHLNKIDKIIEEDEEYEDDKNLKNNKNFTSCDFCNNEEPSKPIFCFDKIVKFGSTIVVTVLLTYIILFIL
jgi:hypothetical protein